LIPELNERGHRAIAMDLPCDQMHIGLADYADIVTGACQEIDEPVVVVGHSLAGMTIPLLVGHRPVERLIFLNAVIAQASTLSASIATADAFVVPKQLVVTTDGTDGFSYWNDVEAARTSMYHDCAPKDAEWAFARLRRQSFRGSQACRLPVPRLHVPSSYILCTEDRLINPDWSRRAARSILGTEAIELPGGHAPFLAHPARLAKVLDELVG
jgi:pimeloyl-ACP methyl ester carboxylesterase